MGNSYTYCLLPVIIHSLQSVLVHNSSCVKRQEFFQTLCSVKNNILDRKFFYKNVST